MEKEQLVLILNEVMAPVAEVLSQIKNLCTGLTEKMVKEAVVEPEPVIEPVVEPDPVTDPDPVDELAVPEPVVDPTKDESYILSKMQDVSNRISEMQKTIRGQEE